jgi:hypothetical protein
MNQQHWPNIAVILSHHFRKPGCSQPDGGGKTCSEVFKNIGIASGSTFSLLKLITWMAKRAPRILDISAKGRALQASQRSFAKTPVPLPPGASAS